MKQTQKLALALIGAVVSTAPALGAVTITQGSQIDKVNISNFGSRSFFVEAFVSGNFIQIPPQSGGTGTLEIIEGGGDFNETFNRITLQYTYRWSGFAYSCTAIYTKQ